LGDDLIPMPLTFAISSEEIMEHFMRYEDEYNFRGFLDDDSLCGLLDVTV
jgi:hypothetical protein